jgi:hypothetical protein
MELLIIFAGVAIPLFLITLFVSYKAHQEERKEQEANLQVQHS